MEWCQHKKMNKEGFLNQHLLKVLKLLVFVFSFFLSFKYYGQNIFSRTVVPYLMAKVERKEQTLHFHH